MREMDKSRSFLALPALLCLVVCLVALLLIGCSLKYTSVDFGQDAESDGAATAGTPGSGGPAVNVLIIKADNSTLATKTEQDARGELAGAFEGATAATAAIKDALSNYAPDLSKKDSENTTDNSVKPAAETTSAEKKTTLATPSTEQNDKDDGTGLVDTGTPGTSEDIDYKNKATYTSYGVRNGGRQAWRINKKGPDFGDKIKIVFSDGKSFTITNTAKNCRDREDTCNRDKSAEMNGFVFKPGIGENGDGDDNTGTSHGGVYLHAPYGNNSKQATFYY